MKKVVLFSTFAASLFALNAMADSPSDFDSMQHWIVRGGLSYVKPVPKTSKLAHNDGKYETKSKSTANLSLTYLTSPHIGFQLAVMGNAALDQNTKDSTGASAKADTLTYQQTSLTAQYYLTPGQQWEPYVGLGVAYNRLDPKASDLVKSEDGFEKLSADNTFSPVVEAGIDYNINDNWLVNASVNYSSVKVNEKAQIASSDDMKTKYSFNPMVVSLNIGYRF